MLTVTISASTEFLLTSSYADPSLGIPQSVGSLYGYSCPSLLLLESIEGITLPLWIVPAYANDIILSHFNPMSKFTHTETT